MAISSCVMADLISLPLHVQVGNRRRQSKLLKLPFSLLSNFENFLWCLEDQDYRVIITHGAKLKILLSLASSKTFGFYERVNSNFLSRYCEGFSKVQSVFKIRNVGQNLVSASKFTNLPTSVQQTNTLLKLDLVYRRV